MTYEPEEGEEEDLAEDQKHVDALATSPAIVDLGGLVSAATAVSSTAAVIQLSAAQANQPVTTANDHLRTVRFSLS